MPAKEVYEVGDFHHSRDGASRRENSIDIMHL